MAEVLPLEQIEKFMAEIFERDEHAQKAAAPKAPAILEAGSGAFGARTWLRPCPGQAPMRPPLAAPAKPAAIERFLHKVDPREPLLRLFDEEAPAALCAAVM